MRRSISSLMAAAAMLAVMCSGAWAANVTVDTSTKEWTSGNNYIVSGNVTIDSRIEVKGSVTLILNDGCKLDAPKGIDVSQGNSLTVTTPSGSTGTGKLFATNGSGDDAAGIGGGGWRSAGDITILGGEIQAFGGACAAGIGGGRNGSGGKITIRGGTVTATSGGNGYYSGAGIGGGGSGDGGEITISGGTVTAKGGLHAAGIGGGLDGSGGTITILGGTVNVVNVSSSGSGGHGIGGHKGGKITIRGGTITAKAGAACAGIGFSNGGEITITGGIITATSTWRGAGISGNYITILDGTVTATGGEWGEGIGGGDTTISGGTVTAKGGGSAAGIGGRTLSSTNGSAWIVANRVTAALGGFNSGILINGNIGSVRQYQAIKTDRELPRGTKMTILTGATLAVKQGAVLKIAYGATLEEWIGGKLVNDGGIIVNDGYIQLTDDSSAADIKKLSHLIGRGYIQIHKNYYGNDGSRAIIPVLIPPTKEQEDSVKRIIEKIRGGGKAPSSSMRGLKAAEGDDLTDGRAEVKDGDILIYTEGDDGSLRAMSINVEAEPDGYAVIAGRQMGDVTDGDDAKGGTIAYVSHFFAPNDEEKTNDVEFDRVPASESGDDELDKTIVVINGKASKEVQAMPEYRPSGLADGQGLAVLYDEDLDNYVLVIFDGDETDGVASAHICAKEDSGKSSSGGSGCDAGLGMAAMLAFGLFGMMKRR